MRFRIIKNYNGKYEIEGSVSRLFDLWSTIGYSPFSSIGEAEEKIKELKYKPTVVAEY